MIHAPDEATTPRAAPGHLHRGKTKRKAELAGAAQPAVPDDGSADRLSVAGEEDPGAALDTSGLAPADCARTGR